MALRLSEKTRSQGGSRNATAFPHFEKEADIFRKPEVCLRLPFLAGAVLFCTKIFGNYGRWPG